ncbi:MAG: sugar phosphate nucleotidyltransferase [Candidatus Levybacteria bacterium]|nr:sugar phosphate nucleotidyltransferase [Candidatus Levybacteria bacterium]
MYAIILAGGDGTRLRPFTNDIPKPMVEIGGKPILEHLIVQLKKAGIEDVILAEGYKAEIIQNYFEDGQKWEIRIHHIDGLDSKVGSAKAVKESLLTIPKDDLCEDVFIGLGDIFIRHGLFTTY